MKSVIVKPKYHRYPALIVQIDGEFINLLGKESKQTLPKTLKRPSVDVVVRGATQEDLIKIMDNADIYGDFSKILKVTEVQDKPVEKVVTSNK